ncbi:PIN domain-containing protein [Bordetella genomosp. 13]|uniref:PIN domain-containing protein n=1 Tax=Bordetella genomosp. 13 TaxID=463040 RepID=UPI0021B6E679|nr:PIN domain-containing protein [Bordetella genomosp. 13]
MLDANILIRATLGRRVRRIISAHEPSAEFLTPNTAYEEARKHLPALVKKRAVIHRGMDGNLDTLTPPVSVLDRDVYTPAGARALARIGDRDPDDWPVLACALALDYPVWTEDRNFFGTGVATWTTDRVELYFNEPAAS